MCSTCGTLDCNCQTNNGCPIKDLSTNCLITGTTLPNSEIPAGTILSEALEQLDTYIHSVTAEIETSFSLVGIGDGIDVYKGVDGQGRKEIRSIKHVGDYITVTLSTGLDEIEIKITESELVTLIQDNLVQADWNQTNPVLPDYIKNKPTVDGSETKIADGTTTDVTGTGTTGDPYKVEVLNLQKIITGNHTLTSADNNYTIFINNSGAINITVPTGLAANFSVGFVQQGTADVTFVVAGTTIHTPVGLKIKGQNYNALIEKVQNTEVFHLLGNLKA